jgi:hypothetical protein
MLIPAFIADFPKKSPKMSDDEDIQYVKRKKVVHFGALDEGGVPVRGEISADHMQVNIFF